MIYSGGQKNCIICQKVENSAKSAFYVYVWDEYDAATVEWGSGLYVK